MMAIPYIKPLTPELEDRIRRNPSLNIDSFIVPTPYVLDQGLEKDLDHSFVWEEEREILGYIEVWSNPLKKCFYIYKQVTSPFGRSKGIGSAFLAHLASILPEDAEIGLYVWERQTEILSFYLRRGFHEEERINWRALTFIKLRSRAGDVKEIVPKVGFLSGTAEELGKIRHDAKKAIRLIADMAGALTAENCSRIIEDINRETTVLINTLNLFRDSVQRFRTVNLKELIVDRIIPMIDHSPVPCTLTLRFAPNVGEARAHYVEVGRALVNLVSNALDAIKAAGRPGELTIGLEESAGWIILTVEDNGTGIEEQRLQKGPDGMPSFVGISTKGPLGEGQGTRQIYTTFGADNITVHSERGKGTRWKIRLPRASGSEKNTYAQLETRLAEFKALGIEHRPGPTSSKAEISAHLWRLRKLEILIWDLILQFSRKNNVRDLYRLFLATLHRAIEITQFKENLSQFRIDEENLRLWLTEAVHILCREEGALTFLAGQTLYQGIRFKAYGQAVDRTVVFTLNPFTGAFGATDRKLAEHADFVPYLGEQRDRLLRGEFFGDVENPENPIQLGVWEINSTEDGRRKAALIQEGCRKLLEFGVPAEKKVLFYETTWRRSGLDLDTGRPRLLKNIVEIKEHELGDLIVQTEDEPDEFFTAD